MLDKKIAKGLRQIVGDEDVFTAPEEVFTYETDAYPFGKTAPLAVVLPESTDEVSRVAALLYEAGIPITPRGSGTSLSGGSIPMPGSVLIPLTKMNKVLEIDVFNRRALVESGAVNMALNKKVQPYGLQYAPDPSSQLICTFGGNIAHNSGGAHTLKYGVTSHHILGMEIVTPHGQAVWLGNMIEDQPGYNLAGVTIGSEGTLGIVTKVWVRLIPLPLGVQTILASFQQAEQATQTVSDIIRVGIIPAALELMDRVILQAVEQAFHYGFSSQAEAVLLIEVDGLPAGLDRQSQRIQEICQKNKALEVKAAKDEAERTLLWTSRKKAAAAIGYLSPSYCIQDGVIPRSKLPEVLPFIYEIGKKYRLRIGNIFHAGDGNLHPNILFDDKNEDEVKRAMAAGEDIIKVCLKFGGAITGEHGVGIEKKSSIPLFFDEHDLGLMKKVKDVFDPKGLCNANKIFPG